MSNPWLEVDLSDYIKHMSSPEVGQYQMINECFKTMLGKHEPRRIFVPGCTVGNGFEYINLEKVEKITALDVNTHFLKVLRDRFPDEEKLEIVACDFNLFDVNGRNYDLIFAALFFEYVDVSRALKNFRQMMNGSSVLFSLIQLPEAGQGKVSKSQYRSLEKLGPYISLTTPDEFTGEINAAGLKIKHSEKRKLFNGKTFFLTESVKE